VLFVLAGFSQLYCVVAILIYREESLFQGIC
jgi:hypothetical protein